MSRSCWIDPLRIGQERPVRADAGAELVALEQLVRADGDQLAVADLHLAVQLQQPLVLPAILGTEAAARQHDDHRVAPLDLGQLPDPAGVVRQRVVGEQASGENVRAHGAAPSNLEHGHERRRGGSGAEIAGIPVIFRGDLRRAGRLTRRGRCDRSCRRRPVRRRLARQPGGDLLEPVEALAQVVLELANLGGAQLDPHAVQLRGQRAAELARLVVREIQPRHALKVTLAVAETSPGAFSAAG